MEISYKWLKRYLPVDLPAAETSALLTDCGLEIETVEQYPRKICSMLWGDKTDQLNQFNIGDMMKISFDIESREYQGKWFTDVKAWKIEHASEAMPGVPEPMTYTSAGAPPHTSYTPPAADPFGMPTDYMPAEDTFTDNGMTDDLPF